MFKTWYSNKQVTPFQVSQFCLEGDNKFCE